MTDRPPINKRPQMRKSSLSSTIRNTGMSTRNIYEMQVKTANYEAMMQRFQLRKVSDTGLVVSKFQAGNLIIDKEISGVKKQRRQQAARFSLQRMVRPLTRWKTWQKFFQSLGSPITPKSRVATLHGISMLCIYHFQLFYLPFGPSYYPNGSVGTSIVNIGLEFIFLVNLLLNFNTAYYDKNSLVTSRKLIARNYVNKWFIVDFVSAIPRYGIQYLITGSLAKSVPAVTHSETALMVMRVLRVTLVERTILLTRVVRISKHMVAWLRYSRYSHLLGIAQLMWLVLLIAHYMACLWHVISVDHGLARQVPEKYIADYYYAVSLIQGQGNFIGTRDENLYSTVAILVGSVVLAIVFGNVAMLVSNFNASSTNYHRKMEAVFATMDKMKLPDKLRDRIHQYYTHVWTEYESLDGDIIKFQRELTHTLGLEVGLYKYMNLVTEIPFWKDCSPDFATQIILNLAVRVYLPDDYVVRKGETCDEMFMINRGICALCYTSDSDSESDGDDRDPHIGSVESSTRIPSLEVSRFTPNNPLRGSAKFKLQSDTKTTSMEDSGSHVRPLPYRLPGDESRAKLATPTDVSTENSEDSETQIMYPGETTGEMGLIMNYSQPGSIRAVTYVEMCILDRATFQRLISRYPKDRRTVLTHMLRDSIDKGQFPFSWEEISDVALRQQQRKGNHSATKDSIQATLSPAQAAQALVERLDVELPDKTIKFGLQGSDKPLEQQLPPTAGAKHVCSRSCSPSPSAPSCSTVPPKSDTAELLELVRTLAGTIGRIESELQSVKRKLDQRPAPTTISPPPVMAGSNPTALSDPPVVARRAASAVSRTSPMLRPLHRAKSSLDISRTRSRETSLYVVLEQQPPSPASKPTNESPKKSADASDDKLEAEVAPSQSLAEPRLTPSNVDDEEAEPPSPARQTCRDELTPNEPSTSESKVFEDTPSQRVLLHPRSRLSVVDSASRHVPAKQRPSIRRLLSVNFLKQARAAGNPPRAQHSVSSSGRARAVEMSLADQLWSRQSSDSKILAASSHKPRDSAAPDSHAAYLAQRGSSDRSARNYRRRDSRLQSFPEAPHGAGHYDEGVTKSKGPPGHDAAWGEDD
jgi:CRP-like cAMP-binding protein